MNKTVRRIVIALALLGVLGLLAWPKLPFGKDNSGTTATASMAASSSLLRVQAHIVEPEVLSDNIFVTGTIRANEEVDLSSETSGKITAIYFEEGRPVQKGDLLLKINDQELQARLQQAQYRLTLAEDREGRQQQILERGGISREEYESTLNEVNVLRAEVELTKAQIDETEVRAPFDGVIGLRYVSEGSYISPGTRIASLQDVQSIKVDFSIPERFANSVQIGSSINFSVTGVEGRFEGRVYAFEPSIEDGTRTLRLRARAQNPTGTLLPGAFADVELVFAQIDDALTVPTIAVVPELGGKKVFVYSDGLVQERQVETGIRTAERVQIVSGLAPSDTVVTSGIQQLRSGLPVELANPTVVTD